MMENLTHSKTRVGPKTPKMFGNKRNKYGWFGSNFESIQTSLLKLFHHVITTSSGLWPLFETFFSESALGIFLYY